MSIFSTRNSDGASGRAESCNTIPDGKWTGIQDRARTANPKRAAVFSPEAVEARKKSSANYDKRHQN
ncbi:MAG: hypothetical protein L0I76_22475 [Pseudonocardia sp.]|nr:hypothetical protein [Pseudonocardia sp.]